MLTRPELSRRGPARVSPAALTLLFGLPRSGTTWIGKVFDLDRPAQSRRAVEQLTNYADLLSRLTVVEVTGAPDFEGLVEVMGDLLGW